MATGVSSPVGEVTRAGTGSSGAAEKEYEGRIPVGFATDTFDAEGKRRPLQSRFTRTLEELRELAKRFHGVIESGSADLLCQKDPGCPAHKLARAGAEVR